MGDDSEIGDKIGTFILPHLKYIEECFNFIINKSHLKIILSGFPNADLLCILLDSGYLEITNVDKRKNVLQELRDRVFECYPDKVSKLTFKSGNMCSIDGIIQCIVDNDPKIDGDYCHKVHKLLLDGGSKLFLCLRKSDDLTILLSRFQCGYMLTITPIGIGGLCLVILEKLSPSLAHYRFLIDHSQLDSQSFWDLRKLCIQENERRKDMRELIVTSDTIKGGILKFSKYATREIVFPSHMVDLQELQVVKTDRHLKFALSTDNNKYKISIYDLKLLSAKQFCTIVLLDNTVTDSYAKQIMSHPKRYISLVRANTCRLVVIKQCEPAKYLNTKANVKLDLGDICSKLSPDGDQYNTHWKWLDQEAFKNFQVTLACEMRRRHALDPSLMESSPSAAAAPSSSTQLSSVIETSPIPPPAAPSISAQLAQLSSVIIETLPIPPPSAAPSSSAQLSSVIATSPVPPPATLVQLDESPSDTPSSSYEPSVVAKRVMYMESRYSSSSRPAKFEVFSDANDVGSCDYFLLADLGFCISKENLEQKRGIREFQFQESLTSWLSRNVERWSDKHNKWNSTDSRRRNNMSGVHDWNAARPTDLCCAVIRGVVRSVVDYSDCMGCFHGGLNCPDNYLLSINKECQHGIVSWAVDVELVHKVMNNDSRPRDLITDCTDLCDMILKILNISDLKHLPRIWLNLYDKIYEFSDEAFVKEQLQDPEGLKLLLSIVKDHPAMWSWRSRAGYYGFIWRTWNEEFNSSYLYFAFVETYNKISRWSNRIPSGTPYHKVYDKNLYSDSSIDLLRYLRVLHLHIYQAKTITKKHRFSYYIYFSSADEDLDLTEENKNDLRTEENQDPEYLEIVTCELFFPFLTSLHELIIKTTFRSKTDMNSEID